MDLRNGFGDILQLQKSKYTLLYTVDPLTHIGMLAVGDSNPRTV